MHCRAVSVIAAACVVAWLSGVSRGADHFLVIGGGSSPSSNQISLEKNVLYFQRFLADRQMGNPPHEVLFSDGTAGSRDLEFVAPGHKVPPVNQLLGEAFHLDSGLDLQYRAHAIEGLWGPSTRESISCWFDTIGSKLHEGDRLIVYYTGHGGRGRSPRNTTLAIWHERPMPVKEFVRLLDRLPPKVPVVLVMVQCFGGGFANVIYNDADPARGLSPRNRCGFFATLPTRVAAGCTADADEENYHEYSTYFWSALYGRTRTGEPVEPPDYDSNGRVSLAEAHAYSLITSDTIDVSMKTSDNFLRQFSKIGGGQGREKWLTPDSPYDRQLDAAEPPERAELKGLSDRLRLEGPARTHAARELFDVVGERHRGLEAERRRVAAERDRTCAALQSFLKQRWPELSNLLNPQVSRLLSDQPDQVVAFIKSSAPYHDLKRQDDRLDVIDDKLDELERKQAKCQRFLDVAEHVALANNLASVASPEICAQYDALIAEENGTLGVGAQ